MKIIWTICALFSAVLCTMAQSQGWWMTEPISLIQTNLRETDSGLDAKKLVQEIKSFPANTVLFSVGGITAHYPTEVDLHFRSEYLPKGEDLVGTFIEEAHANDMRVIGRFDFSRARREVYNAHPEWFYKQTDGNPVFDSNDLYSICINGGYYHDKGIEILTEALEKYPVDGLFFNWFGNIRKDYFGRDIGLCHCDNCARKFMEEYNRSIPLEPDAEYEKFLFESAVQVAKKYRDLIHEKRPKALFMTYIEEYTDAIVSEADYYKWRSLPQWIYMGSEHVNRGLNTKPDKMVFDLVMPYQEMLYRFASTAGPGIRSFLYQNMAHGAFPAFVVLGTMDQPDKTALKAVRPIFQYYEKYGHEYVGQRSAARVILYARQDETWSRNSQDHRGFFRLLTELHIPFKITNRPQDFDPKKIDLIVVPEGKIPPALEDYIEAGGKVLLAGSTHPGMGLEPTVKLWENTTSSYMRIEDYTLFPSLKDTWATFWEGSYLELQVSPTPMTLIPPGQFGPPDKVDRLDEKTDKPGLVLKDIGEGKLAFLPWHIGQLYYRHSNDKHRLLIYDLINHLLDGGVQIKTNAHPSVEITFMHQPDQDRHLLHLTNLSGHSGTAFFDAIPMRNIDTGIMGDFQRVTSLDGTEILPSVYVDGYTHFVVPNLDEYEVLMLHER
ncbi:MAG: hypothetical protein HKN87_20280 [Saprospiraceae bacterium]|nr:hypothetical protein [Saprospiraceae bacterium]